MRQERGFFSISIRDGRFSESSAEPRVFPAATRMASCFNCLIPVRLNPWNDDAPGSAAGPKAMPE